MGQINEPKIPTALFILIVIVLLAIIVHYAKGEVGDTVRPVSTPLTQSSRVYFGGFAPDFPHYISGQEF